MKILIDCDPGIDDAVAIISALKQDDLDVLALTTVTGNLPSDTTCANARRILELMNATDIPVAQGPLQPLSRDYPSDPFSHGDDGLGNTGVPGPTLPVDPREAAQVIVDVVNTYPGEVSIAVLGPMTNLALALRIDPELPHKVARVAAIAGSFGFTPYAWSQATGDNPSSEWNVYVDPEAAAEVFDAGFPLVAVGLDTSTHPNVNLSDQRLARLRESTRLEARFTVDVVTFVRDRNYQSYCALIDSMAIAALTHPQWFTTERVRCAVETQGELTLGMTVVDRRNHHRWEHLPLIEAVSDVDYEAYLDHLIETIIR